MNAQSAIGNWQSAIPLIAPAPVPDQAPDKFYTWNDRLCAQSAPNAQYRDSHGAGPGEKSLIPNEASYKARNPSSENDLHGMCPMKTNPIQSQLQSSLGPRTSSLGVSVFLRFCVFTGATQ